MISLDPVWPGGQGQRWFEGLLFHVQRLRPSRRSHGTPTTRRRVFDRLSENRYSAYPLAALQGPRSSRRSSRPGLNRAMIYSIGRGNLVSVDRSSSVIRSNRGIGYFWIRSFLSSFLFFFKNYVGVEKVARVPMERSRGLMDLDQIFRTYEYSDIKIHGISG